ncbi:collagen alpha-4(VI) chain-like [Mytilus trossulus]|uniref:collagen alpha-4(VI) chain-like n=1 Tax=Mytilus trossulus TaxID=6551 RepID=UPI0030066EB4
MATNAMSLYMVLMLSIWDQIYAQGVCLDERMDLVIIVDSSSTLGEENFELVLGLAETIVDDIDIESGNVHVGFMTFGTSSEIRFELNEYNTKVGVIDAIYSVEYSGGGSNTADALSAARSKVFSTRADRPDAQNVIILITDGYSDINADRTVREAEISRQNGIKIYAVGVGLQDTTELDQIASQPLDIFRHTADDWNDPIELKTRMFPAARCDGELPPPVDETNVDRPLILDSDEQDLVFLLHFSNDMYQAEFQKVLNFMTSLIERADIDSGLVRVGAALYRESGVVIFNLKAYSTKKEVVEAIEKIPFNFKSSRANLASGINIVRDQMLADSAGDRQDIPNGVVVITDSNSNINVDGIDEASNELKDAGATVFTIGIGLDNPNEVVSVASNQEFSYILNDVAQLPALTTRLQDRIPSLSKLDLRPVLEETIIPESFVPLGFPTGSRLQSSESADVVILFHAGHKLKSKEFNKGLKLFISRLFEKSQVDSGSARGAVINYGAGAKEVFGLNKFNKKSLLRKAIQKMKPKPYRNSKADLTAALQLLRTKTLSKGGGSRMSEGVPTAVVIVTDMASSSDSNAASQEINNLKNMGVTVFTVGVSKSDNNELLSMVSQPQDTYHQSAKSYFDLVKGDSHVHKISNQILALQKEGARPPATRAPVTTRAPVIIPSTAAALDIDHNRHLIIVFQSSSSTSPNDFKILVKFLHSLTTDTGFPRDTELSVISFGKFSNILINSTAITNAGNSILNIDKKSRSKMADLGGAFSTIMKYVLKKGSSFQNTHILVVMDKTVDKKGVDYTITAKKLREKGVVIHGLSVTDKPHPDLEQVVTYSGSTAFLQMVNTYADLEKGPTLQSVVSSLQYVPSTTKMPPVTIAQTTQSITLKATQPPKKYNPPLRDSETADMIIAFHASSSTSRNDFQRMLTFVKDLVSRADFDGGRARLGVMAYGEHPSVQFNLNEHTTWREVSNAISNINDNVRSNIVDTSGAVIEALIMFDDQYARADVPKAVFLITDSASTVNADFLADQTEVMRSEGIEVFPIGIGVRDKSELETIATNPRNVHTVSRYSDLSTLTNLLRRDIRSLSVNGERQTVPTIPIGFPGVSPVTPVGPVFQRSTAPPIAITFPSDV